MKLCSELYQLIGAGEYDKTFATLYPTRDLMDCRNRYMDLLRAFMDDFGDEPAILVSAPGRTEIGGNHTDHQHGNVLAASVNLDIICVASPTEEPVIRVQSIGYPLDVVHLDDLESREEEHGKSSALIRGMAHWFQSHGSKIGGFRAYTTTDVLGGSGLSSSAAFEVVIGTAMALLYDPNRTAVEIAIAGRYAENNYFGKPSGLMDQMASSVGGVIQIDFKDPQNPVIHPISFDLSSYGYNLCIVDTKGSHADLTGEYAAITQEMHQVAKCFGKEYLREVEEEEFYREILRVRSTVGDRATLRAIHFFRDNKLAVDSAKALEEKDIERFLKNIIRSGRSSLMCLQNVFAVIKPEEQGLTMALDISESVLGEKGGAWRVHGGGFAGTMQAFVPDACLKEFCDRQNALFGDDACHVLSIRSVGGTEVTPQ